jgi:hypothetical protein
VWDRQKEAEDSYAYAQGVHRAHPCYYHFNRVLNAERSVFERVQSVQRAQHALCVCCKGSDLAEFCCKQIATMQYWGLDPAMQEALQEQSRNAWLERYFSSIYTTGITYPRPIPPAPAPPLDINSGRWPLRVILPADGADDAMEKECIVDFARL